MQLGCAYYNVLTYERLFSVKIHPLYVKHDWIRVRCDSGRATSPWHVARGVFYDIVGSPRLRSLWHIRILFENSFYPRPKARRHLNPTVLPSPIPQLTCQISQQPILKMVQILDRNIQPLSCQLIYLNYILFLTSIWKPNISPFWFGNHLPKNVTFWSMISNVFLSLTMLYVFLSIPFQKPMRCTTRLREFLS